MKNRFLTGVLVALLSLFAFGTGHAQHVSTNPVTILPIIMQSDCSGITSGMCLDSDDGKLYVWDGDSVESVGVSDADAIAAAISGDTLTYDQIAAFTEANLYTRLSDVTNFCQPGVDETITGYWSHLIFRGTEAEGVLGSIATHDEFWTDGTYDPASQGGSEVYKALKTSTGYKALYDEDGNAYFNTFTTTETEILPIAYWIDGASAPDALETVTSGTEKVSVRTFAADADEDLRAEWIVPLDMVTSSGLKFRVIFYPTNATGPSSEVVQFELAGCSLGDNDALDCTLGTVQTSAMASTTAAQYDRLSTAWSSAMTSTHITNLAAGESVNFKLNRDSGVGSDYEQLVGVAHVEVKYKRTHDTAF